MASSSARRNSSALGRCMRSSPGEETFEILPKPTKTPPGASTRDNDFDGGQVGGVRPVQCSRISVLRKDLGAYCDHGGTIPFIRAYAIDCPICSLLCSRSRRKTPSADASLPKNCTCFCRSALWYALFTTSCDVRSHCITSALAVTAFSRSLVTFATSGVLMPA